MTASGEQYGYAPDNKRVWRKLASGTEQVTFWLGDRALARYTLSGTTLVVDKVWRHFGNRNLSVTPDRVGSNVAGGKRYFPYGEEVAVSAGEDYKFGTYWRDSTGLDYADQRYYASWVGRFVTADPYVASAGPEDPGSWNRYGYVGGDPLGRVDPSGAIYCFVNPSTGVIENCYDSITVVGSVGSVAAGCCLVSSERPDPPLLSGPDLEHHDTGRRRRCREVQGQAGAFLLESNV